MINSQLTVAEAGRTESKDWAAMLLRMDTLGRADKHICKIE